MTHWLEYVVFAACGFACAALAYRAGYKDGRHEAVPPADFACPACGRANPARGSAYCPECGQNYVPECLGGGKSA